MVCAAAGGEADLGVHGSVVSEVGGATCQMFHMRIVLKKKRMEFPFALLPSLLEAETDHPPLRLAALRRTRYQLDRDDQQWRKKRSPPPLASPSSFNSTKAYYVAI